MKVEGTRRDRLLTFLLLPAIVVAVLVLSGGSFRASFQLDKLRDQAVVEASLELANARAILLDQMIIKQDNVVRSEVEVSELQDIAGEWLRVAERHTPTVRAVLVVDLTSKAREVLVYASRAPGPADDEFRHLLLYRMWDQLRLTDEPRDELRHLHRSYGGRNYLLSYWQSRRGNSDFLVLAWHDVARIVHEYLPSLYGHDSGPNKVNVADAKGRIIFGPPLSDGEFTVGRQFQTTLYKWRLNVALTTAAELAARAERALLLEIVLAALSALVVIAGSVVILSAAARERRLANLKSEFVANVSHELKTPLSAIRMFGELLQSGRVDDTAKRDKYTGIIVTESERLTALIENVLDFAKVERGAAAYEFVDADVVEVVARAVEVCRVRAEAEGVELHFAPPGGVLFGRVDERAIEVAVINLVDNALKYAAAGRWVSVAVERTSPQFTDILVRDYGPGIPEEDRKRVFERFTRRDETKRVRGSGIGLALVASIAYAHKGQASVSPNIPRGCVFLLRLGMPKKSQSSRPS